MLKTSELSAVARKKIIFEDKMQMAAAAMILFCIEFLAMSNFSSPSLGLKQKTKRTVSAH